MTEVLPDGGLVRKLWLGETKAYAEHLLRLDPESRHRRFSGAVADELVQRHAETAEDMGVVVHGFFVDGVMRGAAELRHIDGFIGSAAEAAFSIERPWQSLGVGTALLERTLLSARNRGVKKLHMQCLSDNRRMQQLARKFEADLKFDFGGVVGDLDPAQVTPMSLMREALADSTSLVSAVLDAQARLWKAA